MKILIENEEEYNVVLSRIEQLMDAKFGTPEMVELKLLTKLIETYENHHFIINSPSPFDKIKFRKEQMYL